MSIQVLFLTVIGSGLFLLFVIGFLILNAIEKKPLWSPVEFEVTGFDEDFDKVPFSGRFYCNQVNPDTNDVSFSIIQDNGKILTTNSLPYIAVEREVKSFFETQPVFYKQPVDKVLQSLTNSEVACAALIVKDEKVFDLYLLEKGSVQRLTRNRFRVFCNQEKSILDTRKFDVYLYKRGKVKQYFCE